MFKQIAMLKNRVHQAVMQSSTTQYSC